jgi:hypothetical protein
MIANSISSRLALPARDIAFAKSCIGSNELDRLEPLTDESGRLGFGIRDRRGTTKPNQHEFKNTRTSVAKCDCVRVFLGQTEPDEFLYIRRVDVDDAVPLGEKRQNSFLLSRFQLRANVPLSASTTSQPFLVRGAASARSVP